MPRNQNRTNVYIVDDELWAWAQYRAKTLGYATTSEYLFDLVKLDKEKLLLKKP
jgi:prophage antirepressor-like protein